MSQPVVVLPFSFLDELVLRTPALPFASSLSDSLTDDLLRDESFLEAVYLASPVLYAECLRLRNGQLTDEKEIRKIRISLVKYYQRMFSRCTPFGLFSGCSLVKWGQTESAVVLPPAGFLRSTRLDMHYLCALGQHLSSLPFIKDRLLYHPNNSYYILGNELRYIEYRYLNGRRVHQISSVLYSEYLQWVLDHARKGALTGSLIRMLAENAEVEHREAVEFIDEMIASQVLVSEMDPAITGEEFIHQLLAVLERVNIPESGEISLIIAKLKNKIAVLGDIDRRAHPSAAVYLSLKDQIKETGVPFEENKLFQVDMYHEPSAATVNENLKKNLLQAVEMLAKLYSNTTNELLTSFAGRFRDRYEDQAVPLLHVLDAETGIGFTERSGRNLSPLLENIAMPAAQDRDRYDIKWNKTEQWLFDLLINNRGRQEIVLDEKSLEGFSDELPRFPPSMSVLFSMAAEDRIIFRGCSGSSAANLLGRFAHADKKINELVQRITATEQAMNTGVHFAEIVHLPEDRVGNILLHPAFREYEIPFLAQSSLPDQQQVALQDLLISVGQDKQIRLFSGKLGKEIIPRLSSAHNYSYASLPVYHFLSELQTQNTQGALAFGWGSMARHFRFLPRVRFQDTILHEATWQLRREDLAPLLGIKEWLPVVIGQFRETWQLPQRLVLADGDNELPVDLDNRLSVETFLSTVRDREGIVLKEFFMPANAVTDGSGQAYNNQLVAVLMNNRQVYADMPVLPAITADAAVKRKFLPGSEWLYYKIYCGSKTADEILLRFVGPFAESMMEETLISHWFFIRYNDPGFHLRMRFHISQPEDFGKVSAIFHKALEEMDNEGLIASVQTATYQREMERYGFELTVLAEELFFTDSKLKLEFLQLTEGDEREQVRWLWGMRGVDELLNAFGLVLPDKYVLMQAFQQTFAAEFHAGKQLYRQMNMQYNEHRKEIQQVMDSPVLPDNVYRHLIEIFSRYDTEMKQTAKKIIAVLGSQPSQAALQNLLSGYIHMNLNRLFLSEPRQHELLIYDFLCSWYRSQLKRK